MTNLIPAWGKAILVFYRSAPCGSATTVLPGWASVISMAGASRHAVVARVALLFLKVAMANSCSVAIAAIHVLAKQWALESRFHETGQNNKMTHDFLKLGRSLFVIRIAMFGTEHFIFSSSVAALVPRWLLWHLFRTSFVGTAPFAACASICAKRQDGLAAALLTMTLLLIVLLMRVPTFAVALLIYVPMLAAHPPNRVLVFNKVSALVPAKALQ